MPKGVLSTQRSFLGNVFNSFATIRRRELRLGSDLPPPIGQGPPQEAGKKQAALVAVPLFHVTACTTQLVRPSEVHSCTSNSRSHGSICQHHVEPSVKTDFPPLGNHRFAQPPSGVRSFSCVKCSPIILRHTPPLTLVSHWRSVRIVEQGNG